jgi:hypothetical protein
MVASRRRFPICLSLVFLLCACNLPQADERPAADGSRSAPHLVPRADSPAVVDGRLDEPLWRTALALELQYEVEPGENVKPAARTTVLLAYDRETLYVGFRVFEPQMAALRAHLSPRDQIDEDDRVAATFDTFNDERGALQFMVNPLGVQADRVWSAGMNNPDTTWDTIWDSATEIADWGWTAEIAIPFSSIRFQRTAGTQVWGFDALRVHPRQFNALMSIFPRDRNNSNYYSQTVKISGFDNILPARNIELVPTMVMGRTDERAGSAGSDFITASEEAELGLTARWGITPNLSLQATMNPDFSQVEADALQLGINERFALFYDEKRPFFTEGADFFRTPLAAIYTRAVSAPSWGGKITGKEGPHAIGSYVLQDDISGLLIPGLWTSDSIVLPGKTTAAVLHYRYDLGSSSNIGLLMTDREAESGDYFNRVLGVDGRLRLSDADTVQFQAMGSSTRYDAATAEAFGQERDAFSGGAYALYWRRGTRGYTVDAQYERVDEGFRADLGFMPQAGYQQGYVSAGRIHWGDAQSFVSYLEYGAGASSSGGVGEDDRLVHREVFGYVALNAPLQSFLRIEAGSRRVNFFALSTTQKFLNVYYNFAPTGFMRFGIGGWRPSDWIDYTHARPAFRNTIAPWVDLRLGRHLNLYLQQYITSLTVEGDRLFLANQSEMRLQYNFDRRMFLRAILQYSDIRRNQALYTAEVDRISRSLFTQLLFSYTINPRTVLFIGYGDNAVGAEEIGLYRTDRTFFAKVGYSWML